MRPLRILIVTQSYHPRCGGIGENARHSGLALRSRGHSVRILTSGPEPRGGELPGLEVLRIGRRFEIPSNGSRASLAFHPFYRAAIRDVLRSGVDLIQIHSPLEPFLPWAVLGEARAPCIGTFHNAGAPPWAYRRLSRWLRPLADRLAARTAVSRCAAQYVGRHFPGSYLLVPNGVDPSRFRPASRPGRKRPPTILFVGRLEPRKGLEVLIEAIARIGSRPGGRPRLIVVGDGSLRRRAVSRARRARVDVEWRGTLSPERLPACYRDADLLAAPALYGESFGIVLLEALASGLPVVASRIEGFAEVLDGCPAGRLVARGDSGAFSEAIEGILIEGREADFSAAARSHALTFSWTRLAGRIEAVFGEVLDGDPAGVPRIVCTGDGGAAAGSLSGVADGSAGLDSPYRLGTLNPILVNRAHGSSLGGPAAPGRAPATGDRRPAAAMRSSVIRQEEGIR